MNSHDLFRTLVHARDGRPGEDTVQNHYPIKENVDKVGPEDLIVSDYEPHRAEKAIAIVREVCGLKNKVIVTDGGKYRGDVWGLLPSQPTTHTGDHYRSDVESPNQHGIKGIHTTLHDFTTAEEKLIELRLGQLALCCREARLTTYNVKYRGIELVQTDYNFPVLFLASILLRRRYTTEKLLFSGRDCYMWIELFQRLFDCNCAYWQTSCHARVNADENYHRYTKWLGGNNFVLVDLSGSGTSFSKLPMYKRVLMYKPLRMNASNNIPGLYQSEDVWRLEQCNRAPHRKCMGVDGGFEPIWLQRECTTPETKEMIDVQVASFRHCLKVAGNYKLPINATDEQCTLAMDFLLHRYIDFAGVVEPLRLLDIAEDAA